MIDTHTINPTQAAIDRIAHTPSGKTCVVAQLGQSLDGRIATATGDSQWINGDDALDHIHRLRAAVDAVVVGAGTIIADDPRLNVRRCPGDQPARVVIDPRARIRGDGNWLIEDGARRVVVIRTDTSPGAGSAAARRDVDVVQVAPDARGDLEPNRLLAALGAAGLSKLLIEGGANTVSRFIDADALDRLHVLVAPVIIGSGPHGLVLAEIERLSQARRPAAEIIPLPNGDVLFDCNMRVRADEV